MATDELAQKLGRRVAINEAEAGDAPIQRRLEVFNPYTEFKEFTRKEILDLEKRFKLYDMDKDKFLDINEVKHMMERVGVAQTHLGLKEMIREVDEDEDGMISFREFLLIFRKAKAGEFSEDSGLYQFYQNVSEVDVDVEGVKGAKNFFQAKIQSQTDSNKFEKEIIEEQEERKRQNEEAKIRKQAFKEKANLFNQS